MATCRNILFTFALLILSADLSNAGKDKQVFKVYFVNSKALAQVQVKLVDNEYGADLCVFPVESKAMADFTAFASPIANKTAYISKSNIFCD